MQIGSTSSYSDCCRRASQTTMNFHKNINKTLEADRQKFLESIEKQPLKIESTKGKNTTRYNKLVSKRHNIVDFFV